MVSEVCLRGLLLWLVLPSPALAHRLDEYLQATLVHIEPGEIRLQINLTPGVAVAEQVLALIDRDRDGKISTNEAAAYCELLKRDLRVRLDQNKVALKLTASSFSAPADLRTGWGIIQLEFSCSVGLLATGPHKLSLKNRHLPASSVYLFNAAQPASDSVRITSQKRNESQSTGEIEFTISRPMHSARLSEAVLKPSRRGFYFPLLSTRVPENDPAVVPVLPAKMRTKVSWPLAPENRPVPPVIV
jgi:hypothetical protein